jgi:2-amino-4-hydroxy-6-hydroxymethyldihydropteridine diphosphokinase
VTRIRNLIAKSLTLIRCGTKVGRVKRAFVGLGANLGDREGTLRAAVRRLGGVAGTGVTKVSALRDTEPVGYLDQPRFLNGVVELETSLSPRALLDELLAIEREFGRDRSAALPQGPRTLDLDLLLYGGQTIREPGLEVPHPRLHERAFVLEPLAEVDPGLEVPGFGPVQALLAKLDSGE